MKATLQPDHEMANRFLDLLTGSKDEAVTFQFYTDTKTKNGKPGKDPLARKQHEQRPINFAFADQKQLRGAGVWIMVNAGDGNGRSASNVVKVRALFIDLDGTPWEPAATALKPHMRVESSPGRWHLYWLVSDCDLGQFKSIQQAIARKFDGDKACCDLPRVLRLPGFYHLKNEPVMSRLVEANDFPRYATQQVIDGLGLNMTEPARNATRIAPDATKTATSPSGPAYTYTDTQTGEVKDLAAWAAQNPGFNIVAAINSQYACGQLSNGKQHIICPFADEHTDTGTDLATFVANANDEHSSFEIHCCHDHCADRDRLEFLQVMFNERWLATDKITTPPLELRNPLWVSLPVKEILASPEWSILAPDERRVAFDLLFFAWQSDDGTIEDNDWKICKLLGMTGEEWQGYRKTLDKAGWLIVTEGRLTSRIVKREFGLAQLAYSKSCAGGKKGGLKTQAKRRVSSPS